MFRLILILLFSGFLFHGSLHASEVGLAEFKKGISYFKQKKFKSALTYFKRASNAGMDKSTLHFNLGVTYYKLKRYKNAEKSFKRILKDKYLRQIAFYNLGLVAEKQLQKKKAIYWYRKSASENSNSNLSKLANSQLTRLLNRQTARRKKNEGSVSLAMGYDDNVTSTASSSPSNTSDHYIELFSYINTQINPAMKFKAAVFLLDYNDISTEDFRFFSAGLDYTLKAKNWKISPEFTLTKSTLNNSSYQDLFDFKVTAKHNLNNNARLVLRYCYSEINSKNTLYDYLEGSRHQFRADYKMKIDFGRLRLRYQLETNDRQNTLTENYSPTRHSFRARLKHKLKNKWKLSEEIGYRFSDYDAVAGITRSDTRLRLRVIGSKKINKEWSAGIRFTHTNNNSNVASEKYSRNNIQLFTNWDF